MLLNEDLLTQTERQLDERSQALRVSIDKLESRIADESASIDKDEAAQLANTQPDARRLIRQTWEKTRKKRLSDLRKQLADSSEENRSAITAKLDEYEASIDATLSLHRSPVQALSREGLGDTKRTEYQTQLANAGPAELQSMADLALATNDKALAAAVLTIADRNRKRYSQFDRAAFAEKVLGEKVAKLRHRLEQAKVRIRDMRMINESFVRGTTNPVDRISLGLAQQRLQPKPPLPDLRGQR